MPTSWASCNPIQVPSEGLTRQHPWPFPSLDITFTRAPACVLTMSRTPLTPNKVHAPDRQLRALEYWSKHKCSCLCRAPSRFDPQASGACKVVGSHQSQRWEETMTTVRFSTLVAACLLAAALCTTSTAWAQKKYTISRAPSSSGQYLQQHAIDVDGQPGPPSARL